MPNFNRTYPQTRLRRSRQFDWSRRLVRENQLSVNDLIWPVFIVEGEQQRVAIPSMPGVYHLSIDLLLESAQHAVNLGIPALALFPAIDPSLKTVDGAEATNPDNLICRAIRALKASQLDLGIICDVALDPYTSHGHDGILVNGDIANDPSVEILCAQALVQAQAGCDVIAPSDMQDGRIGAIRHTLDQHDFHNTLLLSYAAKYCSAFYGPFRDAIGSNPNLSGQSKHTYQQDSANQQEALHEVALDLQEGADLVMIKPGMPYLDIIYRVKSHFQVPTLAYQVSGEYSMLKQLSSTQDIDFLPLLMEAMLAFKRAGADAIFTYAALELADHLHS